MYKSYTYFIKNKVTGEYYYGSRCKNVKQKRTPSEDFWIIYFTSSNNIKNLRDLYGNDSFEYTIVLESADYGDCYWLEQSLIKEYISDPLCLNEHYQDRDSGAKKFSTEGHIHSDQTKEKIRKKAVGRVVSAATIEKIKTSTTGKKKSSEHIKSAAAGRKGKKNKNPAWNKGLTGLKGHPNPLKGTSGIKSHTQDSKDKIGAKHKGRTHTKVICPHCNKEGGYTSMKRWHFDNCKHKIDK